MSTHYWCHGTYCHKSRTQDRVRGSKGSKVLRTSKVKQNEWNEKIRSTNIFVAMVVIMILLMQT